VFFFLKIIGNPRVAAVLFLVLVIFSTIPAYSPAVTFDGSLTWWDWSVFALGAGFFLSLGAIGILYFFEPYVVQCGQPGEIPLWAQFLGFALPSSDNPTVAPIAVTPPLFFKPKVRMYPFKCKNCGADTEVTFVGSPCPFCGEAPTPPTRKRKSLFLDDVSNHD
jgi:hypothetical protein